MSAPVAVMTLPRTATRVLIWLGLAVARAGAPSAVRRTRTVSLPLMVTGVPSGSAPAATASNPRVWPVVT
jgi:hypothetical protein